MPEGDASQFIPVQIRWETMPTIEPTALVNADHPLPQDWEPDDLVDLWKLQPRHFHLYLRQTRLAACAAEAANALSGA